jgi:branched-chain amino acid aminotransferase
VTRGAVLEICRQNDIPHAQTQFSLSDVYSADEAFVTGTFAGLVPVKNVDGREIGSGSRGPMVERLQGLYIEMLAKECADD